MILLEAERSWHSLLKTLLWLFTPLRIKAKVPSVTSPQVLYLVFYYSYWALLSSSNTNSFAAPYVLSWGLGCSYFLVGKTLFTGICLANSSISFKSLFKSHLHNEPTLTTYLKLQYFPVSTIPVTF